MLKTEWEQRSVEFRREAQGAMRALVSLEDWERMAQASSKNPWLALLPVPDDYAGYSREVSGKAWQATPIGSMLVNGTGRFCEHWAAGLRDGSWDHSWADQEAEKAMESMWKAEVQSSLLYAVSNIVETLGSNQSQVCQNVARMAQGLMRNPLFGKDHGVEVGLACINSSVRKNSPWTAAHRSEAELWVASWTRGMSRTKGSWHPLLELEKSFAAQWAASARELFLGSASQAMVEPKADMERAGQAKNRALSRWALWADARAYVQKNMPELEMGWGWALAASELKNQIDIRATSSFAGEDGKLEALEALVLMPAPIIERLCSLGLEDIQAQALFERASLGQCAVSAGVKHAKRPPAL